MAISFVGSAANSASPNATYQVTLPGGCQAGDLILVTFAVGDNPGADNDLSGAGLTEVADLAVTSDTNDTELFVGYRYFVGGDTVVPTSAWTAIGGTNAANASVCMVFRGVETLANGGPFTTTSQTATGTDTPNANPPSIATAAGDWVVAAVAAAVAGGTGPTFTAPTNYTTNAVSRGHDDTVDVITAMAYRDTGLSNPEDPGAFTGNNVGPSPTQHSWCAVTMALKPAADAAYPPKPTNISFAVQRAASY